MNLTTFESTTKAYTHYDNPSMEMSWEELIALLSQHDPSDNKTDVLMFNIAKFKDQTDPTHENGRRYVYENNIRTDEFEYIPETVRRSKNNVVSISGIVLDVDGTLTIPEVFNQLIDIEYFLYTTFSHTVEKHKFRVIIPFAQDLLAEDIPAYEDSIKKAFPGVDSASFTCSQSFYFHSGKNDCMTYHNKGRIVNPYTDFTKAIIVPYVAPVNVLATVMCQDFKDAYAEAVTRSLFSCSGFRFAGKNDGRGVLTLINICKSIDMTLDTFITLCQTISEADSTLKSPDVCRKVWSEWSGDRIHKDKRDKFIAAYKGTPVIIERTVKEPEVIPKSADIIAYIKNKYMKED